MARARAGTGLPALAVASAFVLGTALVASCTSGEFTDGNNGACDVPELLATSCAGPVCHGAEEPAAGLDLVSEGVEERLIGVRGSADCDEQILIEPGYPNNSLLIEKVSEENPSCGRTMPPMGHPLSPAQINCLEQFAQDAEGGPSCETCGDIRCIDLMTSEEHCGECGEACDAGLTCALGTCVEACEAGLTLCDTTCVDLEADDDNCGACGKRCGPGSSCDGSACVCDADATATFAEVLVVFNASCGGSECHTGDSGVSDLQLGADVAYEQLVDAASDGCEGRTRVVPGDPGASYLVEKMVGGAMCNGKRMPLFADLDDEAIAKVVGWVCAGAPEE